MATNTILGNNNVSLSLVSAANLLLPSSSRLVFNPAPRTSSCLRLLKSSPLIPASRASLAAILQVQPDPFIDETKSNILACPICYERVNWNGKNSLECKRCRKLYSAAAGNNNNNNDSSHLDLTITAAAAGNVSDAEPLPASIELFRLPLMSYLYERGWRQCFSLGGFPGPKKEFEMIKDYLKPVLLGGNINIMDASCGSGMFSRLFAKSGLFSRVFALDFSETMLNQCSDFIKQDDNFPQENLILVRADISRLPFASASVDVVHAGAALHCWPSPSAAVAEISRVLKPGGLFVATTFVFDSFPQYLSLVRPLRQNFARLSGMHFYLSEKELEDLCTSCGLVDYKCTRNRNFVMISAMKPV